MKLTSNELMVIKGGLSKWFFIGLATVGIFAIGVVDGFIRPLRCNR